MCKNPSFYKFPGVRTMRNILATVVKLTENRVKK